MTFIETIPEDNADELLQTLYQADAKLHGYVPNFARAFSLHPEAYQAWKQLISPVRSRMRLRRYELLTFATAMAMKCTYWMLAHGAVLRKNFFSTRELVAIVRDFRHAGLSDEEVAIMQFAQKISTDAKQVSESDFNELRKFGIPDKEILDIVLACTARVFFSKTLDALNAAPDDAYLDLEPELREALVIGRPFG